MFHSLIQETSAPLLGRQRSLIEALFGINSNTVIDIPEKLDDVEWVWEDAEEVDFVDLVNNKRDVKFHKRISSGTAVVRGSFPMSSDQYFWEVQMISPVYGTDMMVGVGTSEANMSQVHDRFISLLGNDNKTWGLSYTGLFHHDGEAWGYSPRFGQGSIIGMHLDMWNGTLSFYKNKKHLGIAIRGLKGKTLYAMASSTAACSGMRILRTSSFPSSLQFLCCAKLRELIPDDKDVLQELTFPPGLRSFLENNLGWLLNPRCREACSEAPAPAKKRGRWVIGMNETGELMRLTPVAPAVPRDDGEVVMVGSTACILCNNGGGRPRPQIRGRDPLRWRAPRNPLRWKASPLTFPHFSRDSSARATTSRDLSPLSALEASSESPPINKDSFLASYLSVRDAASQALSPSTDRQSSGSSDSTSGEKDTRCEAKRRRHSYNYQMGLSDPDSD